jgi:very-short-patch-repair endonuclease
VTHAQLRALGLDAKAIQRRRRSGYLRPVMRGVYAVGHLALPPLAQELAAVLSCGPGACLSHHTALRLWGMLDLDAPIHVAVKGRNPGLRAGVLIHRLGTFDATSRHGIPITTPVQTLIHVAPSLSPLQLARAFDEGRIQRLISPQAFAGIARCPGARHLRALATDDRGRGISREGTEELMLALIRQAGLPAPDRNVRIGRWSIDMFWPAQRVAVELDSYGFHTTRSAFERDHEKDHVLRAHDIDLLRFTWHQVHGQPEQTLVRLATALARPRRAA